MLSSTEKGGLKVPDIFSMVKATKFTWIKRYISPGDHIWKILFEHALKLSNLNHELIFYSNFDIKHWKEKNMISEFYQEVLSDWFQFNGIRGIDKEQVIWYNKNIRIQNQPVFYQDLFLKDLTYVGDLYTETNELRNFTYWKSKGMRDNDFLRWAGLISAIPKGIKKENIQHFPDKNLEIENLTYLQRPLKEVTSKFVYNYLISLKCGEEVNTPRITKYINLEDMHWTEIYLTALTIPIDSRTREFQFRFLHDALINSYWLKKWNILENDLCTFCKKERETIIHLFWQCEIIQEFWQLIQNIYSHIITNQLDIKLIITGSKNALLCTLIFIAKRYIYECRFKEKNPEIREFKAKLNYIQKTEWELATRNNTVLKYLEKWEVLV